MLWMQSHPSNPRNLVSPLLMERLLRPLSTILEGRISLVASSVTVGQATTVTTRQVQIPGRFHCIICVGTYQCPGCSCLAVLFVLKHNHNGRHNCFMRACPSPACAGHFCANQSVLAHKACLRARVLYLRGPFVRVLYTCLGVRSMCLGVYFVYTLLTCSIAVSFPTP